MHELCIKFLVKLCSQHNFIFTLSLLYCCFFPSFISLRIFHFWLRKLKLVWIYLILFFFFFKSLYLKLFDKLLFPAMRNYWRDKFLVQTITAILCSNHNNCFYKVEYSNTDLFSYAKNILFINIMINISDYQIYNSFKSAM